MLGPPRGSRSRRGRTRIRTDRLGTRRSDCAEGSRTPHGRKRGGGLQGVGLLCREALITLGQVVWVAERHPPVDGVIPSDTDAKRRLEAYIAVELGTNANEQARKHANAALDLAVGLQHKRSATWRDAAMCLEATASVVRLVTIVEGRRDPG